MAIEFRSEKTAGRVPEIWRGECVVLPGGFKPLQTFAVGTVLRRGTPIRVDFGAMTAAVCKVAQVVGGGTTTKPRVPKGHYIGVGDSLTKVGDGKAKVTVQDVDTSAGGYDVLTLSAAYTGLAEGDTLVECAAEAVGDVYVAAYRPNMIVAADKHFDGKGIPTIDAAYDAVVLYPSLGFGLLPDWLNGCCLKENPNILFIKQ